MFFHIDMNSYFASVEQQFDVKLRGKPVGVCAYLSKNGCIIASSIEAKQYGVKTTMRVQEALRLCPKLLLVENDPKKYRATTKQIFSILKDYSDEFEPYSIDEAFLRIPYVHNETEGYALGHEWNQRIKREVGECLRSSTGFAESKFYAKVFSDNGPKNSTFHVPYPQLDNFLAGLELEDIWGIGRKTAQKLRTLKLFTPFDVKQSSPDPLIEVFGKCGYDLWKNLNLEACNLKLETEDIKAVSLNAIQSESGFQASRFRLQDPKSIGHSYCLLLKTYNLEAYKKILYKLCERTCVRLREMNKVAYGISFALPQRNNHNYPVIPSLESKSRNKKQTNLSSQSFAYSTPQNTADPETNNKKKKDLNSFCFLDSRLRGNDDSFFTKSHASFKTSSPISDALDMYRTILPHLENLPRVPMYMIAVSLFNLSSKEHKQLSLFDPDAQIKKDSLLESFDSINRKWGSNTLQRGLMFNTQQYAKERIGFRKL